MDIRHLRYFVAVAENLSFSEAARRLNMSQPPLSQRIRELETQVGADLFRREAGRIELSPYGEELLPKARHLLDQFRVTVDALSRERAGIQPPVRIVNCTAPGSRSLPMLLRALDQPGVDNHHVQSMSLRDCLRLLIAGEADVAVGPIPEEDSVEFESVVLHRDTMAVALPGDYPLRNSTKVSLVDLVGEQWLLLPPAEAPLLHEQLNLACRQIGMVPRLSNRPPTNADHCLTLVALGKGITLTSETMVGAALTGVKVLPLYRPQIGVHHRAVLGHAAPSQLQSAFRSLQDQLRLLQLRAV